MDSPDFEAEAHESKRRKVMEKRVVTVKIEGISEGRKKNEGPPSDSWSWRKYGQKPIKGSPYPRGYYRCSTSKGCSAKKQVERCKNDASMLIITYSSTHNHPTPDNIPSMKHLKFTKSSPIEDQLATPKDEQEEEEDEQQQKKIGDGSENENHFHYCQSPFSPSYDIMCNHSENPFEESIENTYGSLGVVFDEEPLGCPPPLINFSAIKSEEYDFYDELEELPHSSIFMRKDLFDERILVHPS